jgi:hypothetical protein
LGNTPLRCAPQDAAQKIRLALKKNIIIMRGVRVAHAFRRVV